MDWRGGFSALYELKKVDPMSFNDMGSFEFVSGTIDKTDSGLMESADLAMTENPGECWVRIYLKARQEQSGARVPLFTGLASVPERTLDGVRITYNVECYSVLKPVEDILVTRGYYAPAGADAAQMAAELLKVGPAPVVVDSEGPSLEEAIVAEDDMTNLDVVWLILNAIGWRLRIEGNGTIHVCGPSTEPVEVFDTEYNDVVEVAMTDSQDWFSVPNCIRVTSGNNYVEYIDDDPESNVSTVARQEKRGGNGQVWIKDQASSIGSNESLGEYAMRILRDNQSPARSVSYARRFFPSINVTDMVGLHLPRIGIDGTFRIKSQKIELGHGCRTSEEVVAV